MFKFLSKMFGCGKEEPSITEATPVEVVKQAIATPPISTPPVSKAPAKRGRKPKAQ
jgi:hypothetical protein